MADSIPLLWDAFHAPKKGNTSEEYEDAFAGDPAQGRFAVTDGASESAFAGAWAGIVAQAYVRTPGSWSGWLPDARKLWRSQVQGRELPWYAETKFHEGAFAATLGLIFHPDHWRAEAIGDCCLFQIRQERLCHAFPISRSQDFDNRPVLLGSRNREAGQPKLQCYSLQGDWRGGDLFYLMTDALAQWFLTKIEGRGSPWRKLQRLETPEQFAFWLDKVRTANEIRNDDVTLLRIHVKKRTQISPAGK